MSHRLYALREEHKAGGNATPTTSSYVLALTRRSLFAFLPIAVVARAWSADPPFIDDFGPVGAADDTATFNAALRSGKPFRLRGQNYRVAGPVSNNGAPVTVAGVPGRTRISCAGLASGTWFHLASKGDIDIDGVIWDGNGVRTGSDAGMVGISGEPPVLSIRRCGFLHATNPAGLVVSVNANGADSARGTIKDVEAAGGAGAGIWIEHGVNLELSALRLHDNKNSGIRCARYANRSGSVLRHIVLRDSRAWANGLGGFEVGTYNEAPGDGPAVLGPRLADVIEVTLQNLIATGNQGYGIAAYAENVRIIGCHTSENGEQGGIDVSSRHCLIESCEVTRERGFGIDTGGCEDIQLIANRVSNIDGAGFNPGGSIKVRGRGNRVSGCTGPAFSLGNNEWGGGWFPYTLADVQFVDTTIDISRLGGRAAIEISDGGVDLLFDGLDVTGRADQRAERVVYAQTRGITFQRCRFNGSTELPALPTAGMLTIPDMAESVVLPPSRQVVTSIRTASAAQVGSGIGWISVSEPGSGYDPQRSVATLEGDGTVPAGSKLVPCIWGGGGGQLVGFRVSAPGSGFTRASVRMSGPGSGARIEVHIGVPIPAGKRLRLIFPGGGQLSGMLPHISVPPGGAVGLTESRGRWILA